MADHEHTLATVKSLIKQFTGQAQTLTVPKTFVRLTGDHVVALVLNQILFWSDKTTAEDGWFFKEHADWRDELEISPDQLRRAVDKLAALGVQRRLKKAGGAPKLHFRIDLDAFTKVLLEFLTSGASPLLKKRIIDKPDNQESRLSDASGLEVSDSAVSRLSGNPIIESVDNQETPFSDNEETRLSDNQETSQSLSEQLNTQKNTSEEKRESTGAREPPLVLINSRTRSQLVGDPIPFPFGWCDHWTVRNWWSTFEYRTRYEKAKDREPVEMSLHWQQKLEAEVKDAVVWLQTLEFWDGNGYRAMSVQKQLNEYKRLVSEAQDGNRKNTATSTGNGDRDEKRSAGGGRIPNDRFTPKVIAGTKI